MSGIETNGINEGDLAAERWVAACEEEEQERFARFAGRNAIQVSEEVICTKTT